MAAWPQRARRVRRLVQALAIASRDPRTPRLARILAVIVAGYALSPIDLIPDVIPVLGYLDDLVLIPIGVALTIRLIPPHVWTEARARANNPRPQDEHGGNFATVTIGAFVLITAATGILLLRNRL